MLQNRFLFGLGLFFVIAWIVKVSDILNADVALSVPYTQIPKQESEWEEVLAHVFLKTQQIN